MTAKTKAILGLITFVVLLMGSCGVYVLATFRVATVPTPAMANTIIPYEKVLYRRGNENIQRGDILVFKYPNDQKVFFMKRVIGLPGETVEVKGPTVLINGQALAEKHTYINFDGNNKKAAYQELKTEGSGSYQVYLFGGKDEVTESQDTPFATKAPLPIPPGHYFMMGDCRDNSLDSRYWGTLPRDLVVGKVMVLIDSADPIRKQALPRWLDE